jgi:hypothetical protein
MKPLISNVTLARVVAGPACLTLLATALVCDAAPVRVLPQGQVPKDARLEPPKDLDGYFPFTPSPSPEAWAVRAERVRRQLLVSLGLWPLPTRTPLHPVIHGRVERDDYTVEKVYFESMPGFFVTGNLYRPKGRTGKLAGVLCPHGHWPNGRFLDTAKSIKDEIAHGGEKFEEGGRSVLQARCVQLARMGCVVFHYDMLGYADSIQIPMEIAHGFSKQRPEMNAPVNWGLFSPQAEEHSQSIMGLQTWNSIRSLDFLLSLPEVDENRVGVTGASGGGTQTFILGAIDPRPTVAFPAVMVSTAMQGGCTCENACGLRVDTGNVEFAALFAPKPLGMTGADDWTHEMATKGSPELHQHYAMMGVPENVHFQALNQFGHNYNHPSRAVMYGWMNKHLHLGVSEPVVERDYKRLSTSELSVWDDAHPKPPGGPEFERKLLRWWHEDAQKQIKQANVSTDAYRKTVGGAVDVLIGRPMPAAGEITYEQLTKEEHGKYWTIGGMIRQASRHEENPVLAFYPNEWNGRVVVWIHPDGKAGLCDAAGGAGQPSRDVQKLVDAGIAVMGIDLVHQGEFLKDGEPYTRTARVKNPRESAAYTFGYNPTVFAQRVHDVLKLVSFVKHHEKAPKVVDLVGLRGAGHWVAAARAQAGDAVTHTVVDTQGFRFGSVTEIHSPDFLPGGAKYGDLPGMLSLGAPGALWLGGETPEGISMVKAAFKRAHAPDQLALPAAADAGTAVDWLLARK